MIAGNGVGTRAPISMPLSASSTGAPCRSNHCELLLNFSHSTIFTNMWMMRKTLVTKKICPFLYFALKQSMLILFRADKTISSVPRISNI